jgi:hypothetical protein
MEHDGKLTDDGTRLVRQWKLMSETADRGRERQKSAELHEREAATDLAKWILPPDAGFGEKFSVWIGDSLLSAARVGEDTYWIGLRYRGKRWSDL